MDALTGLPTFHSLEVASPTATVFLDIDGFKRFNCDHGHLVGDDVLRRAGAWLAAIAQSLEAQAYRVAGEEFLVLLPGRRFADADFLAHIIVASCPRLFIPEHPRTAITMSAVVFTAEPDLRDRLKETLDGFAERLYRVEVANGREYANVVHCAQL